MLEKPVISCSDRDECCDFIVEHAKKIKFEFVVASRDYPIFAGNLDHLLDRRDDEEMIKAVRTLRSALVDETRHDVPHLSAELIKRELSQ